MTASDNLGSDDLSDLTLRREASPQALGATLKERLAAKPTEQTKQPRAAGKRPRGNVRAQIQIQRDVARVKDLMLQGCPRSDILSELSKLSVRTVDRYIAAVHEQRRADAALAKPHEIETSIARISYLSRKAEKAEAWSAVARYESMLLDIRGVRAPEKHDVRALVAVAQTPAEVDPGELLRAEGVSDEQLRVITDVARGLTQKRAGGLPMLETTLLCDREYSRRSV